MEGTMTRQMVALRGSLSLKVLSAELNCGSCCRMTQALSLLKVVEGFVELLEPIYKSLPLAVPGGRVVRLDLNGTVETRQCLVPSSEPSAKREAFVVPSVGVVGVEY